MTLKLFTLLLLSSLLFMNLGSLEISAMKVGLNDVHKVYKGSEEIYSVPDGYDIFLIAGQSNTFAGEPEVGDSYPDATYDATDSDIFQLGRYDGFNNQAILAEVPLDSKQYIANRVGFALAFAKMYKANGHLASNRDILIVHCGEGGSTFRSGQWLPGGANYVDTMARINTAMALGSGVNIPKAVLWQHGEGDSTTTGSASDLYEGRLNDFIDDVRAEFGVADLPFIAGGMVPATITPGSELEKVQTVFQTLPSRVTRTGYADPENPTELTKSSIHISANHYSGRSQRGHVGQDFTDYTTTGNAGRYWVAYLAAKSNN